MKQDNVKTMTENQIDRAQERLIGRVNAMVLRLMRDQNVSQKKLAEQLGTSAAYVSKIVNEGAENLTLRSMAKIFGALGHEVTITTPRIENMDEEARIRVARNAAMVRSKKASAWTFTGHSGCNDTDLDRSEYLAEVA